MPPAGVLVYSQQPCMCVVRTIMVGSYIWLTVGVRFMIYMRGARTDQWSPSGRALAPRRCGVCSRTFNAQPTTRSLVGDGIMHAPKTEAVHPGAGPKHLFPIACRCMTGCSVQP